MQITAEVARTLSVAARHLGLILRPEDVFGGRASDGLSKAQVVRAAARSNLRCRFRRMTWRKLALRKQDFPAVVFFKDGTSMVLVRLDVHQGASYAVLEDPHAGPDSLLILDRLRFEELWTGDSLSVQRIYIEGDDTFPFSFELISRLFFQQRRMVIEVVASTVALSLLALAPMFFLRTLFARVLPYKTVSTLVTLSLLMLVFIGTETGFKAVRRYIGERIATKVDMRISTIVFNRLLRLPIEYFETVPAGVTLFRLNLLRRLRDTLLTTLFEATLDVGVLIIFVPFMMIISVPLTLMILFCLTLTVGWVLVTMPVFRKATADVVRADTMKATFMFQNLAGIRTVKSLALDAHQRQKWGVLAAEASGKRLVEGRVTAIIEGVSTTLQRVLVYGTMLAGVYLAIQGDELISIPTLFTFVLLSQRVGAPLGQAATMIQQYDEAYTGVRAIAATANYPTEAGRSGQGFRTPLKGHVEFVNLRFKYRGAVSPALRSVTFEAPAGMTLGIMGRSGSGKTTITRLLQRLHSDYQGLIKVDGVDVREYDVDHLRSSLGVVLQENFLFSGTIRDNITVAKSDASFEEVVQAARLAGAEEFIDKLPQGYDTYIYEGSPNLSGGQRQRLAIARALITNPKLLILDEATSALDAESEAIVNANLKRIAQGRTMLVISHRLSSLVNADAIMVLDRGEVHDIGKHHELLERCDIYSGLWYHQNPTSGENEAA